MRAILLSALALVAVAVVASAQSDTSRTHTIVEPVETKPALVDAEEQIFIETLTGKIITIDIKLSDTVATLKSKIHEKEGIPEDQQRLIFGVKHLDDEKSLSDYGVQPKSLLNLVVRVKPCNKLHLKIRAVDELGEFGVTYVKVERDITVASLKQTIEGFSGIPVSTQKLFVAGEELEDERKLEHYDLHDATVIVRVSKLNMRNTH